MSGADKARPIVGGQISAEGLRLSDRPLSRHDNCICNPLLSQEQIKLNTSNLVHITVTEQKPNQTEHADLDSRTEREHGQHVRPCN